jgi:alkylation response protein AidB-like acyl-CoA dehydrogenase
MVANGEVPVYEASLLKVLSNECRVTWCSEITQMLGEEALIRHGSPGAIEDISGDSIERQLRDSSTNLFGGGSNDVQRDIIGFHGLGLPR